MHERSTILWRRLDLPGHEAAYLELAPDGWRLGGSAVFGGEEGEPCALTYEILCDGAWRTVSSRVTGWIGARSVNAVVETAGGRWTLNGGEARDVEGAIDVDLNFSPSTNLLPIRRLDLAVGAEATVVAAWLRFPSFTLERLEQTYRRTGPSSWRYESAGGRFARDLEVRDDGFVTQYPGLWVAE